MPSHLIYLDHTATTPPLEEVVAFYADRLRTDFANPSSAHRLGQASLKSLNSARERLARILDCRSDEIITTSGGSESINTALKGLFPAGGRIHGGIATCPGEHAATRNTCAALSRQGVPINPFHLLPDGSMDLVSVEKALNEKPIVLTAMLVNNETGALAPVDQIVKLRDRISPRTRIHIDAVQAMGKIPLSFRRLKVDLLSLSGHKFGAPRGIGLLIVRHGLVLSPLIDGGGQQGNRRSGTENPPLVEALALAAEMAAAVTLQENRRMDGIKTQMQQLLAESGLPIGPVCAAPAVPHILSIRTAGLRGETLVNALSAENIMVSAGSACSSHKATPSPVLKEMGLSDEEARSVVRISFGRTTTEDDTRLASEAIIRLYRQLARAQEASCRL